MRTQISGAFTKKAYLIKSIYPKDWLRIVSPGIWIFDHQEESVIQLLDYGVVLGCGLLFDLLVIVTEALLGPGIPWGGRHAAGVLFVVEVYDVATKARETVFRTC